MSLALRILAALFTLLAFNQCRSPTHSGGDRPTRVPAVVSFERDIKPILEIHCVQCHNSSNARANANLDLETRHLAMSTGRYPPVIKPGDPDNSLFIQALTLDIDHPTSMPPSPDKIWDVRLEILKKWIAQGAVWPQHVRLQRPEDWGE